MQFSYKIITYLIYSYITKQEFSTTLFFLCFLPNNYFINFYVVLLIFAPLLNLIFKLKQKTVTISLLIAVFLFSVFPTIATTVLHFTGQGTIGGLSFIANHGSDYGYTIVVFILIYLIGGYIRTYNITVKKIITGPLYLVLTIAITAFAMVSEIVWYYDNAILIMSAISLFLFFKEIRLKENKVISFISKCSLGVFLLHIEKLFTISFNSLFYIEENVTRGYGWALLNMMAVVLSTVAVCCAADIILRLIVMPLKNVLYKTKALNYPIINID